MGRRRKPSKGIPQWDEKLEMLRIFFGCSAYDDRELTFAILGRRGLDRLDFEEEHRKLTESLRKYGHNDPDGSTGKLMLGHLVDRIQERWQEARMPSPMADEDMRTVILRYSAEDFVKQLFVPGTPGRDTALASLGIPEEGKVETVGPDDTDSFNVVMPVNPHVYQRQWKAAILEALKIRRLDQKLHYLTPSAEGHWRAVVSSGAYMQYEECKLALYKLFNDEQDHTLPDFFHNGADGAVMLGCGAGAKDELIIQGILDCGGPASIYYGLVDVSPYMLDSAAYRLKEVLRANGLEGRVHILPLRYDFVDSFHGAGKKLRRPNRNVAWFLPGGTLGNLDEDRFFRSIVREGRSGDLVVVGVETVGSGEVVLEKEVLRKKYDIPAVRQFVSEPLRDLMKYAQVEESPQIKVDTVPNEREPTNPFSCVEKSVSVEVWVDLAGHHMTLLTSTRYDEKELIRYAEDRGIAWQASISSPLNERFRQLVFRLN